ncbi:retroviral-like aspartic protease family protein [Evansella sp. AB-P1]|uniref:aspartyl protease family protein n=1 Tax=Evansella sp. AB-P1 TaxID=3037653 RepID=UPI00241DC860|nr:aspartyl protease family protein [Evansella sp. AB-P1]MDG5786332.1 retroviral-like aspartic protease family protein [Evansella sp. AB-P1]
MKSLRIENGFLLTEMKVTHDEASIELQRILVDTCSNFSVLSMEKAEGIGLITSEDIKELQDKNNENKRSLIKPVCISVGPLKIVDFPIEIQRINDTNLEGVLGLDFLKRVGAKINLDAMTLSGSRVI